MSYSLEGTVQFIFEKQTKPYIRYSAGASEKKIAMCVKSVFQRQALPGLEGRGE